MVMCGKSATMCGCLDTVSAGAMAVLRATRRYRVEYSTIAIDYALIVFSPSLQLFMRWMLNFLDC